MTVHSLLLLLHIMVLDTAIGSRSATLLSLVILVQFAEVKSAADKTWKRDQIFDMCCDDVTERFTLLLYVALLFFLNFTEYWSVLYLSWSWLDETGIALSILYLSEVAVDWIKHMSICNKNSLAPGFYLGKLWLLKKREHESIHHSRFLHDHSEGLTTRFGLWSYPLAAVSLRILIPWARTLSLSHPLLVILAVWVVLLVLKAFNMVLLTFFVRFTPFARIDAWFNFSDIEPIVDLPSEKKNK
eukprot:TRINITY_DN1248_c0_g3_i3.p1 TRINITY_DN1248_c0_g3~~TRINITY_DN1248_c0_g3_i3.p1  ORF type:complete len:243 (-),score=53.82 TRINITY_DN1248_c0_g3_i3:54-782(-)